MRIQPEYVMKMLKEHFGPEVKPLYRANRVIHRMNGAPKLERRNDGSNGSLPMLNFGIAASDSTNRKGVFYFERTIRPASPSDAHIKMEMRKWYEKMCTQYYGNVTQLPGNKPDTVNDPKDII
jgi:hypothetical protein